MTLLAWLDGRVCLRNPPQLHDTMGPYWSVSSPDGLTGRIDLDDEPYEDDGEESYRLLVRENSAGHQDEFS